MEGRGRGRGRGQGGGGQGGNRHGGGGGQQGGGNRQGGAPGGPRRGGGGGRGRPGGGRGSGGPGQHQSPLEVGARSTRNALRRHAESVKDEQSQLACRALLTAVYGNTQDTSSPAELLGVVEQVAHVLEAGRREDAQLPVAIRAAAAFAVDTPRRQRDVEEMLRLLLRHGYALAADHVPRQLRDDGAFRASALGNMLEELASEYLDDRRFAELQG